MPKDIRTELVAVRFSKAEFEKVNELRQRINMTTNGKMIRHIVLLFAMNHDFDFILRFGEIDDEANTDLPDAKGLLIEQIHLINEMLEVEGIIKNKVKQDE